MICTKTGDLKFCNYMNVLRHVDQPVEGVEALPLAGLGAAADRVSVVQDQHGHKHQLVPLVAHLQIVVSFKIRRSSRFLTFFALCFFFCNRP